MHFRRQIPLPLIYKHLLLDCKSQIDLLVEEEVVVELKAIERILPVHEAQLLDLSQARSQESGDADQLQRPSPTGRNRSPCSVTQRLGLAFCVPVPLW